MKARPWKSSCPSPPKGPNIPITPTKSAELEPHLAKAKRFLCCPFLRREKEQAILAAVSAVHHDCHPIVLFFYDFLYEML